MRIRPEKLWSGSVGVDVFGQSGTGQAHEFVEVRRHPRFKLDTNIRIYPRNSAVVRGTTVDISESGMSAMLMVEVPIGEVVRLEFNLPLGEVEIHALVRQRNAFRYGFQFVESSSAQDIIGRTCRQLAVHQAVQDPKTT
jgi:c-di-GMP-binding flagellar brake protein YcgR